METKQIILANGYTFNATENGNNYIPTKKIDEAELNDDNLIEVKVGDQILTNRRYVKAVCDGKDSIIFAEISEEEIAQTKLTAQIQYVAMMCDVDMERI